MFDRIIAFSIKNKLLITFFTLLLTAWGLYSLRKLPIDAVPDITNNQVVVITQSPNLAALEIERYISYPIEQATANIPQLIETRSLSRFGISVVTLVFEDNVDIYWARNQVSERLKTAQEMIQPGLGSPKLAPVSTGLSEIYQYYLKPDKGFDSVYNLMELRTIQDWILRKELIRVPGVADVSSFGGFQKQYYVQVNPDLLKSHGLLISDVYQALEKNSANTGAAYLEKDNRAYFIRGIGMLKDSTELLYTSIRNQHEIPVLVKDIGTVGCSGAVRYGAMSADGKGEVVGGVLMMLKGENASEVIVRVKEKMNQIQTLLPKGLHVETFLDRGKLVDNAIHTVSKNLIEGGLIVIFVLTLLLGNIRAGFIVASVIPLCMLFAISLMVSFGISGNLMSLGAIDFGLIVDGAVIIVEYVISTLMMQRESITDAEQRESLYIRTIARIRNSSMFGELIIFIVYIPILSLTGIEGKMFRPMALTVLFAIAGAFLLSLTYVPMMCSVFLKMNIQHQEGIAEKIIGFLKRLYRPVIALVLRFRMQTIGVTFGLFIGSILLFMHLGGEFIPELNEGDYAMETRTLPGSSLTQSLEIAHKIEQTLLSQFPDEIQSCVSKVGTSEIATDPMPLEAMDVIICLKPIDHWKKAHSKIELDNEIASVLSNFKGVHFSLQQPIQMRFNELMTSAKTDVVIRLYGEDLDQLSKHGEAMARILNETPGACDVQVQRLGGLPQIQIEYKRKQMASYGIDVAELNDAIQASLSGKKAGTMYENEKGFDIMVRLDNQHRNSVSDIENVMIACPNGAVIPVKTVADVRYENGPAEISRENAHRRINIGFNIRGRSVEDVVHDAKQKIEKKIQLPSGYYLEFGGSFENLMHARQRLIIVLPAALIIILFLLFLSFNSIVQCILVFTCIPLAAVGGILSLWLRDMPFSISAGVGFIALFGVAVLNGLVLVGHFNELRKTAFDTMNDRIKQVLEDRFRPVIITALVASIGFLPMAFSNGVGAEIQKPLATVVIGGLITSTLLTLVLLPVLLSLVYADTTWKKKKNNSKSFIVGMILISPMIVNAQASKTSYIDSLIQIAKSNNLFIRAAQTEVREKKINQKTAYALPDLDILVQSPTGVDFRPALLQNIDFPLAYSALHKQYSVQYSQSQIQEQIQEQDIIRKIHSACIAIWFNQSLLHLYTEQLALYDSLNYMFELRLRLGDVAPIEAMQTGNALAFIRSKMIQATSERDAAHLQLKQLTGVITISDTAIEIAVPTSRFPGIRAQSTLLSRYLEHEKMKGNSQFRYSIYKALPGLSIGYFNQADANESPKYHWQAGIKIPLFFWNSVFRIQAAKLNQNKIQFESDAMLTQHQNELEQSFLLVEATRINLDYLRTHALPLAQETIAKARIGLHIGESNFSNYLYQMDKAFQIRQTELEVQRKYMQEQINYHYLQGDL